MSLRQQLPAANGTCSSSHTYHLVAWSLLLYSHGSLLKRRAQASHVGMLVVAASCTKALVSIVSIVSIHTTRSRAAAPPTDQATSASSGPAGSSQGLLPHAPSLLRRHANQPHGCSSCRIEKCAKSLLRPIPSQLPTLCAGSCCTDAIVGGCTDVIAGCCTDVIAGGCTDAATLEPLFSA